MWHCATPSRRTGFYALALALVLGGCAYRIPEVDPADIPRLQRAITANPANTDLQVELGMAQYKAEQYEQARTTLQAAVDSGNQTGAGLLYLGMTQEHFENWSGAQTAYSKYLNVGQSAELKNEIRQRLQLVAQSVLKQQAQQALARESEISAAPPTPRSVAVFPFGFNSDRQDLEPLIYALSDMMITDFSVSNALTVLERAQIQTLLDEMSLTEAGYADASTGARAGRLLHAEHVVQGVITTLGGQDLSLAADILNTSRAASDGTVQTEDQLDNLFDMEKDLVFRTLRDVLGVQLTPAEEQRIRDNRAENVLAFLAYGRGLRERDRGNYQGALQQFQQAAQLDPSFGPAQTAASEASDMSDAANTNTDQLGTVASTTGEVGSTGAVAPPTTVTTGSFQSTGSGSNTNTLVGASEAVSPNPTSATLDQGSTQSTKKADTSTPTSRDDSQQESTGSEGKPVTATIKIRITKPGGGGGDR